MTKKVRTYRIPLQPLITITVSDPVGRKITDSGVRFWIGPEVDDGYLLEPKQSGNSVSIEVPHELLMDFGAERVMQAIASGIYDMKKAGR